jgi:hypothetical protein
MDRMPLADWVRLSLMLLCVGWKRIMTIVPCSALKGLCSTNELFCRHFFKKCEAQGHQWWQPTLKFHCLHGWDVIGCWLDGRLVCVDTNFNSYPTLSSHHISQLLTHGSIRWWYLVGPILLFDFSCNSWPSLSKFWCTKWKSIYHDNM